MTTFFDDLPKISEHFPNILWKSCKDQAKFANMSEDCRRCPKTNEDFRVRTEMFRSYGNSSEYFLKNYVTIAMEVF